MWPQLVGHSPWPPCFKDLNTEATELLSELCVESLSAAEGTDSRFVHWAFESEKTSISEKGIEYIKREAAEILSNLTLNPVGYGKLLAKAQPQPIKDERAYDRVMDEIGRMMEKPEDEMTEEEGRLLELLAILIEDYDDRNYQLPRSEPHKMLKYLLEEKGLKPRDLWPVLRSKSRVSEILSGKRSISKAQAKKLSAFLHVPVDLLI